MGATVTTAATKEKIWEGGQGVHPLGASYGKMMMWFFILSDSFTFAGFLAAYGFTRFKFIFRVSPSKLVPINVVPSGITLSWFSFFGPSINIFIRCTSIILDFR